MSAIEGHRFYRKKQQPESRVELLFLCVPGVFFGYIPIQNICEICG